MNFLRLKNQSKKLLLSTIALWLIACSSQQILPESTKPTPVDDEDYIADESSVGVEYTARNILKKGETFTPNKVYFVEDKIKSSSLKTLKDSGNLRQQNQYRREDQKYLLTFFTPYLKDKRFSLICSPVKYGLFGKSSIKDENGETLEEYLFSVFEGKKLIGVMLKPESHELSKKCLKYRKATVVDKDKDKDKGKDKDKSKSVSLDKDEQEDVAENSKEEKKVSSIKKDEAEDEVPDQDAQENKKETSILGWFSQQVL